ncbi:extracellular solute-binding protein [Paenibacillus prosopidis]|uniref:Aldotetraouronic acid ABC transporter substrate-binding protein /aldotetraouronic acid ABC transporter substrate-binding protein n=1 Tax=Paenibacillus prosopidis TaxID=630520 RepID=A0A368W581_9BACL|nr:extracellular solute-binding protein [Paenibacillus prosopidis]RCW49424.1 aldotetraouronic acid ABC transporter substrate-binding protein /aldotetraouronic acid ABC transporter substrate-binding protein [Paenibacillus prosopidis]
MKGRRWIAVMLVCVLVTIVGCSTGGNNNVVPPDSTNSPSGEEKSAQNADGKFEPPVTITTARVVGSDYTFINGEDIHNNVHNKWAAEKLGINIKDLWDTPDNAAYHTKIRLSLTTQDQLPDVFIVQDVNLISDLIQSGKVKDIQQDFDQYASERMKQIYEDNSGAFNQVKMDGKLMGLPIFSGGDGTNPVLWIRQDWLDKLKLEAPTTIEEFEKVMEAFTKQDPDGNGKDDTFGFSFSARNGLSNWMSDASFVFGAYTGKFIPGAWQKAEDGSLKYGSVQPEIKDGLGKLREWYAKGYLDPELAALDEVKATESLIQGKSGMIAAPFWANGWPLGDVKGTNPDALLRAYPLPEGPDGKSARYTGSVNEGKVMMFNKDFEHMDAFFYYMDKIYDSSFGTGDFKYGFFEGYDYAMVDGEPVYDSKKFPTPLEAAASSGKYNLFWNNPSIPFKGSQDYDFVYQGNTPETTAQKSIATSDKEQIRAGALNFQMKNLNSPNEFMGAPTETMRSKGDNLKTMELETFAKIIYGNEPLDKFDAFVADWKSKGGDSMEKEVNDWYASISK